MVDTPEQLIAEMRAAIENIEAQMRPSGGAVDLRVLRKLADQKAALETELGKLEALLPKA
jgi:hypothetical protein